MHPRTRVGIGLLHSALNLASRPAVQGVAARFAGGGQGQPDLPRYDVAG